jgi:hypothetical protein
MRRVSVVLFLLLACWSSRAHAQIPNCGTVSRDADLWQAGYNLFLWAGFSTTASVTGCWVEVQAEGWIVGVGDAVVDRAAYMVYAKKGQPIPNYGRWESFGKHWAILGGVTWLFAGETHKQVTAIPPPTGDAPGGAGGGCVDPEFEDDSSRAGNGCDSPIILDLAGDGYRLTSVRRGVTFDLDADGTPEQVAWTRQGSDDGWLALDRNGNGVIDNGAELFGNHTPAYADKADPTAEHGFMALRFAEGPTYGASRPDDRIDARDAVFARLLVWTDRNHNGFSEPDELQKLSETPVTAISTDFRESRRRDRHGNQFRLRARSWWQDGSVHPVFDVWLLKHDIAPETETDDEP